MTPAHINRLQGLERALRDAIRGQDHVIAPVVERVIIGESGLATPGRPKGSFFLVGPTGVGKTELVRVLSRHLFDAEPLRLDMAELAADDAIKNFIGDQTGNLGRFGDFLTRYREGIFLIDEIEKAHRDVVSVFLSVLDAARVTCGTGRTFDLSGFYFIFSSNLGALDILRAKHLSFTQVEKHVLAQVATAFRPEFLGRIASKIVFKKLAYEVQVEIAQLKLDREGQFLAERGHSIAFSDDVLTFLLQVGFDKYLGARPLEQAMELHIRAPIGRHMLKHAGQKLVGTMRVNPNKSSLIFDT